MPNDKSYIETHHFNSVREYRNLLMHVVQLLYIIFLEEMWSAGNYDGETQYNVYFGGTETNESDQIEIIDISYPFRLIYFGSGVYIYIRYK